MKLSVKQVALIIVTVICVALFVMWLCLIVDNLRIVIFQFINYSDAREFYISHIYDIILGNIAPIIFFSLYLWLAISAFIQEIKRRRPRPESADK